MTGLDDLPLRDDLRGQTPYGAPQLDVRARLNVNENPFPPSESLVADVAVAVAEATRGLNRYPDRDAVALRADLAAYLSRESGVALTGDQLWAANGSNEVMHQLLLAFGGPGRTALGFDPTYSMYPEYCRDTFTRYVTAQRDSEFRVDAATAVAAIAEHRPLFLDFTGITCANCRAMENNVFPLPHDAAGRRRPPQDPGRPMRSARRP